MSVKVCGYRWQCFDGHRGLGRRHDTVNWKKSCSWGYRKDTRNHLCRKSSIFKGLIFIGGVNNQRLFVGIIVWLLAVTIVVVIYLRITGELSVSDGGIVLQIMGFVILLLIKSKSWMDTEGSTGKSTTEPTGKSTEMYKAIAILAVIGGLILQLPILGL